MAAISLEPVAYSVESGALVLIARCHAGTACPALSSLRVEQLGAAEALPGTVEVRAILDSVDQLVLFRPAAALDPGATYLARVDRVAVSVPLAPFGVAAPLERATARTSSRLEPVGLGYSCDLSTLVGRCGLGSGLSWHARAVMVSTLTVSVPANEGWLFRSYQGAPPLAGFSWRTSETAAIDLSPDVESCLTVEGWNVLSDARETRQLCATGPRLSDAERNKITPTPPLGACAKPPVRSDTRREASELLDTYCRERAVYCAGPAPGPTGCSVDPACTKHGADAAAAAGQDAGTRAADGAAAGAGGEGASEESGLVEQEADGAGCSLGRRAGHAWALALLLFARAMRRKRTR